ncbi:MAG: OsmC family protein [Acidobacteriia bacterium]|nr:OsmC family protein [Terriglobia bacterium]
MAVKIEAVYEGDLHCTVEHGPSHDRISTDAPVDNQGKGERFSPTDLVAASLSTCLLTTMGIAAQKRGIDIRGARAEVWKEMSSVPRRHVGKLTARIELPARLDPGARAIMETAARGCPVTASLGPGTEIDLTFHYV